mmetsp:Transcript_70454/g.122335  ORF Transcript_70454/g.122335 Transcript_70454/m.122335 type:complete len:157 (-) Transcript_70454:35-505(-)
MDQSLDAASQGSALSRAGSSLPCLSQAGWNVTFRGHWTPHMKRGSQVIEIDGATARWKSGSHGALQVHSPTRVSLEKSGRTYSGKLDRTGKLCWSNGQVWVRHEITEGRKVSCKLCLGTGKRNPYEQTGYITVGRGTGTMKCPHCFGTGKRSAIWP